MQLWASNHHQQTQKKQNMEMVPATTTTMKWRIVTTTFQQPRVARVKTRQKVTMSVHKPKPQEAQTATYVDPK